MAFLFTQNDFRTNFVSCTVRLHHDLVGTDGSAKYAGNAYESLAASQCGLDRHASVCKHQQRYNCAFNRKVKLCGRFTGLYQNFATSKLNKLQLRLQRLAYVLVEGTEEKVRFYFRLF